jgi:hypothetical protein
MTAMIAGGDATPSAAPMAARAPLIGDWSRRRG